jgi:hypothetical protein
MILRLVTVCLLVGAAVFAGCASAPSPAAPVHTKPIDQPEPILTPETAPQPKAAVEPRVAPSAPAAPSHKKSGAGHLPRERITHENPKLQPGEYALTVESEPTGMTVVMNGKPSGKTPCTVIVQANGRGFLREQVSIKVRFVAADETEESRTIEEVLSTLDKVPAGIRFTQSGAFRIVR